MKRYFSIFSSLALVFILFNGSKSLAKEKETNFGEFFIVEEYNVPESIEDIIKQAETVSIEDVTTKYDGSNKISKMIPNESKNTKERIIERKSTYKQLHRKLIDKESGEQAEEYITYDITQLGTINVDEPTDNIKIQDNNDQYSPTWDLTVYLRTDAVTKAGTGSNPTSVSVTKYDHMYKIGSSQFSVTGTMFVTSASDTKHAPKTYTGKIYNSWYTQQAPYPGEYMLLNTGWRCGKADVNVKRTVSGATGTVTAINQYGSCGF